MRFYEVGTNQKRVSTIYKGMVLYTVRIQTHITQCRKQRRYRIIIIITKKNSRLFKVLIGLITKLLFVFIYFITSRVHTWTQLFLTCKVCLSQKECWINYSWFQSKFLYKRFIWFCSSIIFEEVDSFSKSRLVICIETK